MNKENKSAVEIAYDAKNTSLLSLLTDAEVLKLRAKVVFAMLQKAQVRKLPEGGATCSGAQRGRAARRAGRWGRGIDSHLAQGWAAPAGAPAAPVSGGARLLCTFLFHRAAALFSVGRREHSPARCGDRRRRRTRGMPR